MAQRIGYEGVLAYKVGGQSGGGAYVTLSSAADVSANLQDGEAASSTRATAPWETVEPAMRKAEIEVTIPLDETDVHYVAFWAAYIARTMLGIQFRNKTNGGGFQMDMKLHNWRLGQALGDTQTIQVTLKACRSSVAPTILPET